MRYHCSPAPGVGGVVLVKLVEVLAPTIHALGDAAGVDDATVAKTIDGGDALALTLTPLAPSYAFAPAGSGSVWPLDFQEKFTYSMAT